MDRMTTRRFGFSSNDIGGETMHRLIMEEAKRRGHAVIEVPSGVPGAAIEYLEQLQSCDVVFVNFGSFHPEEEISLVQRIDTSHTKIVVSEDVPGSSDRKGVINIAHKLSAIVTALPGRNWEDKARKIGVEHIEFQCGPPPHWRHDYMAIAKNLSTIFLISILQKS